MQKVGGIAMGEESSEHGDAVRFLADSGGIESVGALRADAVREKVRDGFAREVVGGGFEGEQAVPIGDFGVYVMLEEPFDQGRGV